MNHAADSRCPICGGSPSIEVGSPQVSLQAAPFVKADYCVVRCGTCSFYFVAPEVSLSREDWERLYGEEYFEEMVPWWARKREQDRKHQLEWLERSSDGETERFLEIGCGEGRVLVEALSRGWKPCGIDITDNRIDAARSEDIDFVKGDLFEASFPNASFDSVYMNSVLEHVVDPLSLLREVKRVLRTGGILFFGVPNEDCLYNDARQVLFRLCGKGRLSARLCPFKPPYHVGGFTRRSLMRALEKTGFDIVRLRNFAGEYEWRKYKLFSRPFLIHFLMLPVHLIAIALGKRVYFEVIARKKC
jgi:SAM-dependent methyltransferase